MGLWNVGLNWLGAKKFNKFFCKAHIQGNHFMAFMALGS